MHQPVEDRAAEMEKRAAPIKQPLPETLTDPVSKCMMVTPQYVGLPVGELAYFPLRARGEAIRFIMHYAGLPYEMRTVSMGEWAEMKPTTPKGQLPVFTPTEGVMMCESADIAKHVAELAGVPGLVPADGSAATMFDACGTEPLSKLNPITNFLPAAQAEPQLAAAVADSVKALKAFESKLSGNFFGGEKPHYGEFALLHVTNLLKMNDAKAFASLGALVPWYERMATLPRVKEYLKARPKAASGSVGMPDSRIATLKLDE